MSVPEIACQCDVCKRACTYKPGWFMPGQAETLAANVGLSLQELLDNHLMVDFYMGDDGPTFVLSPAVVGETPGKEFPWEAKGRCAWYKNGLCAIHELGKPFECASMDHADLAKGGDEHRMVADAWNTPQHQAQIAKLLGRPPEAAEPDVADVLSSLLGSLWT